MKRSKTTTVVVFEGILAARKEIKWKNTDEEEATNPLVLRT
jgi:hypothetical protein